MSRTRPSPIAVNVLTLHTVEPDIERPGDHAALGIRVDGVPLPVLAAYGIGLLEDEPCYRPFANPPLSFATLEALWPSNFGSLRESRRSISDKSRISASRRVRLLDCGCWNSGCWPLEAKVDLADGVVSWSDFAAPALRHLPAAQPPDMTLIFDARCYRRAVADLMESLRRTQSPPSAA